MAKGNAKWMVAAAAALWATSSAHASQATISYLVQDRSVSATSSATGLPRGGTGTTPITDNQNQSQQSNGFGTFLGGASVDSNLGPNNALATASATQTSSLGVTGFNATGAVAADSFTNLGGPAIASSNSVFHITFDVTQAESYLLTTNLSSSLDFASIGADTVNISMTDSGGTNLFTPITTLNTSNLQLAGTLNPGTYLLALDMTTMSNDGSNNFVDYTVSLEDGPLGSNAILLNPSAVPLPSAWMDSLVMLGALGLVAIVKQRIPKLAKQSAI